MAKRSDTAPANQSRFSDELGPPHWLETASDRAGQRERERDIERSRFWEIDSRERGRGLVMGEEGRGEEGGKGEERRGYLCWGGGVWVVAPLELVWAE